MKKKKAVKKKALTPEFIEEKILDPIKAQPLVPIIENGAIDTWEDRMSGEIETDNNIKSVSKELFSKKDLDLRTEVSHDEINDVTRLRFLEERFKVRNIEPLVQSFLALRVSKDRKSRREFIEGLQTENRNASGGGFWDKFLGRGNNGGQQ